jgi:DNA-directed RNA polymerase specialized sigma24 family protein
MEEIAAMTAAPVGTAKSRLHRARARLARVLEV